MVNPRDVAGERKRKKKFDRVEIAFIIALSYWLKSLTDEGTFVCLNGESVLKISLAMSRLSEIWHGFDLCAGSGGAGILI